MHKRHIKTLKLRPATKAQEKKLAICEPRLGKHFAKQSIEEQPLEKSLHV